MKRALFLTALALGFALVVPRLPPRHMLFPLLLLPPRFRVLAITVAVLVVVGLAAVLPILRAASRGHPHPPDPGGREQQGE